MGYVKYFNRAECEAGNFSRQLDRIYAHIVSVAERFGYIKRIARKASAGDNLPNSYDLSGLVKAATKHALDHKNKKASRSKEDKDMLLTPTAFSLKKGGNVK